jgi:hypothetical protein
VGSCIVGIGIGIGCTGTIGSIEDGMGGNTKVVNVGDRSGDSNGRTVGVAVSITGTKDCTVGAAMLPARGKAIDSDGWAIGESRSTW